MQSSTTDRPPDPPYGTVTEFARLQAIARTLVAVALPPPLLTPAERAYVDSKAGH